MSVYGAPRRCFFSHVSHNQPRRSHVSQVTKRKLHELPSTFAGFPSCNISHDDSQLFTRVEYIRAHDMVPDMRSRSYPLAICLSEEAAMSLSCSTAQPDLHSHHISLYVFGVRYDMLSRRRSPL
ncbi:unnamed protein product [Peniophora sp. CBMAI 1063]|nr:unnamed protein product [Peniophora sp. CBMAI 1063]